MALIVRISLALRLILPGTNEYPPTMLIENTLQENDE
jgi:hypothetical protein